MDYKKIAKMFFNSFNTDIKEIVETNYGFYNIIFANYADYKKREFSTDFSDFAKKIAEEYNKDVKEIKTRSETGVKSFYYIWDKEQFINIDGVRFILGRRRMNEPHSIIDGVSQKFYVRINNEDLVKEINTIWEDWKKEKEDKRIEELPKKYETMMIQCRGMIDALKKILEGDIKVQENDIWRLDSAHFEICEMIN